MAATSTSPRRRATRSPSSTATARAAPSPSPRAKPAASPPKAPKAAQSALGLIGPNSVAISADGRYLYATSREGASLTSFHRNRVTGALRQLPPAASGCISDLPIPGCTAGRALKGPDVVVVSGDGKNVYVGAFFGNAVASFSRNPTSGALTQLGGSAGCIANGGAEGCATGTELGSIEGLAVAPTARGLRRGGGLQRGRRARSRRLDRRPQPGDRQQRLHRADGARRLCHRRPDRRRQRGRHRRPGRQRLRHLALLQQRHLLHRRGKRGGADADRGTGRLPRFPALARLLLRPRDGRSGGAGRLGDGLSVYVAAFKTGAIDVLDRNPKTGSVEQKPGAPGCVAPKKLAGCTPGRALAGVSSVAVSPDGRNVYSTAYGSNAVDVFRRVK